MHLSQQQSHDWIASRRSVYPKMFTNNDVSKDEVMALLDVAKWAPTHKLTQPWNFKVFMHGGKMRLADQLGLFLKEEKGETELTKAKSEKMRMNVSQSGAVVAIVMKRDVEQRVPQIEEICAVACAVQNIAIHARSMGLGGYWSTGACTNYPSTRNLLELNPNDLHLGWYFLGKCDGEQKAPLNRKISEEFVEIIS